MACKHRNFQLPCPVRAALHTTASRYLLSPPRGRWPLPPPVRTIDYFLEVSTVGGPRLLGDRISAGRLAEELAPERFTANLPPQSFQDDEAFSLCISNLPNNFSSLRRQNLDILIYSRVSIKCTVDHGGQAVWKH